MDIAAIEEFSLEMYIYINKKINKLIKPNKTMKKPKVIFPHLKLKQLIRSQTFAKAEVDHLGPIGPVEPDLDTIEEFKEYEEALDPLMAEQEPYKDEKVIVLNEKDDSTWMKKLCSEVYIEERRYYMDKFIVTAKSDFHDMTNFVLANIRLDLPHFYVLYAPPDKCTPSDVKRARRFKSGFKKYLCPYHERFH